VVAGLPEPEALKLSVYFEEVAAYQFKKNKEDNRLTGTSTGLKSGFEQDFSFGEEDNQDYMDTTFIENEE